MVVGLFWTSLFKLARFENVRLLLCLLLHIDARPCIVHLGADASART